MMLACACFSNAALAAEIDPAEQRAGMNASLLPAPSPAGTTAPTAALAHALQLTADNVGSLASMKLVMGEHGAPTSAGLIVSVPFKKDDERTTLWNPDQTVNGTSIELRVQHWQLLSVGAPTFNVLTSCIAKLKDKAPDVDWKTCDIDLAYKKLNETDYNEVSALYYSPPAAALNYGGGVSVSFKDFTYYDPATLNKQKDRQRGAGADVFLAYQPLSKPRMYVAKVVVARDFRPGDSKIACLAASTPVLQCVQGALAAPEKQLAKIVSLEYRTYLGKSTGAALAVQLARDLSSKTSSVQVPLYLVGNGKDGLTGGIALSYATDDHKVGVAVFVTQGFALR